MESLDNSKEKEKQFLFKCSQCDIIINLSGKIFYCENCKSNYCSECLKGHNEIFFDHEIHQTSENLEYSPEEGDKNSLLANPDLDLDDRWIHDNKLPNISSIQSGTIFSNKKISDLNMLFQETLVSIQENFNEGISKLNAKINENNKNVNNNENNINIDDSDKDKDIDLNYEFEALKLLSPLERLQRIMDIINSRTK